MASREVTLKPVRQMEIFILPHSHNDIGYTALQADVVKKQNSNIETGLRLAKATADYPEGARFKWNVEVLWCVDNYLRAATPEQARRLHGRRQVRPDRPGRLLLQHPHGPLPPGGTAEPDALRHAALGARCGVPIESAMISDVPGLHLEHRLRHGAGRREILLLRAELLRPHGRHDEGVAEQALLVERPRWQDPRALLVPLARLRPGPSHRRRRSAGPLHPGLPGRAARPTSYPYDITYLRWNVHGDNGSPDEKVADVVRDWNARYAWPRLTISTTATAFRAFERRYGDKLPEYSGDYTPYWEDGAASSALETALNRASAERLVQAETLWAIRDPGPFPAAAFQDAWRNILLYSEHTWGAHNSISQPDLPFVRDQWKVKQAFALDADNQSHALLAQALGGARLSSGAALAQSATSSNSAVPEDRRAPTAPAALDVFNTSSWPRTDLVTLSAERLHRRRPGRGRQRQARPLAAPFHRGTGLPGARRARLLRQALPGRSRSRAHTAAKRRREGATLSHPDFTVQH